LIDEREDRETRKEMRKEMRVVTGGGLCSYVGGAVPLSSGLEYYKIFFYLA
jgi:hypothetical protein